ncbi:hypothetical protein BN2475_90080 [Paraburkholderia ribeironis]|uniref:Uncharacterized protein n=1 Tax=Paraburkholderia ribeironis TaxID=1247936 RepID=A0A1N7RN72_9BURK|nr:hypothetical protein BN2475_90080 [Paraburkholderia ribeironis]
MTNPFAAGPLTLGYPALVSLRNMLNARVSSRRNLIWENQRRAFGPIWENRGHAVGPLLTRKTFQVSINISNS